MNRKSTFNLKTSRHSLLALGVLSACLVGGGLVLAQTKQLQELAAPVTETTEVAPTADADASETSNFQSSYSVVVENKTNEEGKIVQTRKVWQDGKLVESEERVLDAEEVENAPTIVLPNGQQAFGNLFRSDEIAPPTVLGDDASTSPFETMRQMEAQIREQQAQMQAQIEEMRRQFSENPNGPFVLPKTLGATPSKYWIGATVEPTPEILAEHLPIEQNQGILILSVVPDSPAAKAGLKRLDVVLKINGEMVANTADVAKIVDKVGAKAVKIEYFRKGKPVETELTPAERPQIEANTIGFPSGIQSFRIVRPGLIVPAPEENATLEEETVETEPAATENEEAPAVEPAATENEEAPAVEPAAN